MFLGANLIHRTYHGQAFHAAASVCACASRRASFTPVAAAVVIAIGVADAAHHARFALLRREFALSFDNARQRRVQEPFRRGSSRGEFHLGGDNLPSWCEGARSSVKQPESQHRARIERFRQRKRDDSRGIARPRLTVRQRQVPCRLAGLVYPQLE
jgi:hypothetical protein